MRVEYKPHVVALLGLRQNEAFQRGKEVSLPAGLILEEPAVEIRDQISVVVARASMLSIGCMNDRTPIVVFGGSFGPASSFSSLTSSRKLLRSNCLRPGRAAF